MRKVLQPASSCRQDMPVMENLVSPVVGRMALEDMRILSPELVNTFPYVVRELADWLSSGSCDGAIILD